MPVNYHWTRRVSVAAGIGIAGRGITICIRLFAVPLTISLLHTERYGLWLMVVSLIGWLGMADLGIPSALQNELVILRENGEAERFTAFAEHGVRLLGRLSLVACAFGLLLDLCVPWGRIFGVPADLLWEFRSALAIALIAFGFGLPARGGCVLYNAVGAVAIGPLIDIVLQVGTFAALLLLVWRDWGSLVGLAFCNFAGILAGPIVAMVVGIKLFKYRPWKTPRITREDHRKLMTQGIFFFLAAIGELLILQSDAFVVAFSRGPSAVPKYLVPASLFINFVLLQNTFLRPLWPSFTKWYAVGDIHQTKRQLSKIVGWSVLSATVFGVGLLLFGDWFIRIWSVRTVSLPSVMAWGLAFYVLTASVDNFLSAVLSASGFINVRVRYTLVFGAVKVVAGILTLHFGHIEYLPGVYALVMALVSLPWAFLTLRRALRLMERRAAAA